MNDPCWMSFMIVGGIAAVGNFIYWLQCRKKFFKACDEYQRLTGKKYPYDFRP